MEATSREARCPSQLAGRTGLLAAREDHHPAIQAIFLQLSKNYLLYSQPLDTPLTPHAGTKSEGQLANKNLLRPSRSWHAGESKNDDRREGADLGRSRAATQDPTDGVVGD